MYRPIGRWPGRVRRIWLVPEADTLLCCQMSKNSLTCTTHLHNSLPMAAHKKTLSPKRHMKSVLPLKRQRCGCVFNTARSYTQSTKPELQPLWQFEIQIRNPFLPTQLSWCLTPANPSHREIDVLESYFGIPGMIHFSLGENDLPRWGYLMHRMLKENDVEGSEYERFESEYERFQWLW